MRAPALVAAELTLTGRLRTASNATFLGSIGDAVVVYKPIAGEKPLLDFPDGCLAVPSGGMPAVSWPLLYGIATTPRTCPRTWGD